MSYVDAILDRDTDMIHVVERIKGERVYKEFPANYVLYYDDPKGKHRTIYDTPVSRFSTKRGKEFRSEIASLRNSGLRLWESDFNPVFRALAEHYLNVDAPKLQTCFFDIEVDFDPNLGFSSPDEAFNPITAITVYLDWCHKLITLAVPPKTLTVKEAEDLCKPFDNMFVFDNEKDMLEAFLHIIDDADILSGWNSEGYDIPYTVNRIVQVLSKTDTRRMCLWDQKPKKREFERYGTTQRTYDLVGRQHLDYMQLYIKYTYHEMHSYSLDNIAEHELGERKVAYEGTLDQLYNQDFYKFIEYNRQDTMLLFRLDQKLRFIDLANELAHANTVLLQTTMGAVAVTEQAIINDAHSYDLIVPDRVRHDDTKAAGAYVATPKRGMHESIGSIDLNSLYPSVIRALNMAPESIVGQLRPEATDAYIEEQMTKHKKSFAAAWEGLFGTFEYTAVMNMEQDTMITVDWADGTSEQATARDVYHAVFSSGKPWMISANGTILRHDRKGVVPNLLETWYAERKVLQKRMKMWIKLSGGMAEDDPDVETMKEMIPEKHRELKDQKWVPTDSDYAKEQIAFWDKRQLVKKINLNSLYGAILNVGCRFFDKRIGQSTTLTGRSIAKHMSAKTNELLTGKYDHVGQAIIYGDTDSVYFSAYPVLQDKIKSGEMKWNKEIAIALYDQLAEEVNDSFADFMQKAFNCPQNYGKIIAAGRELVGERALFIKKKRYAVMVTDNEGKREDKDGKPGKLKAMGLDLKRADTPKFVQDFMIEVLTKVLVGEEQDSIIEYIREFKKEFDALPPWEKGTPKRVNNLTSYGELEQRKGKANMPGHVRAALNWNTLRKVYNDNYSMKIADGMKTIVCKLRNNPLGYTSVAYPIDQDHIPDWYKELPFDEQLMSDTIVDQKLENLLGVLGWDLKSLIDTNSTFNDLFVEDD